MITWRPFWITSQYQPPWPLGITRNSILLDLRFLLISMFSVLMMTGLPRGAYGIDQRTRG
jgi:hypothetical protein